MKLNVLLFSMGFGAFLSSCQSPNLEAETRPRPSLSRIVEHKTVYNTILFHGVQTLESGRRFLVFELKNPRDAPICIEKNGHEGYYGKIHYYARNLREPHSFIRTYMDLDGYLDGWVTLDVIQFEIVPRGESLIMTRELSADMLPYPNELFDYSPYFAKLTVRAVFECNTEMVNNGLSAYQRSIIMEGGNFDFSSEIVGPFELDQN